MDIASRTFDGAAELVSGFAEDVTKQLDDMLEALIAVVLGIFEIIPEIIKSGWAIVFLLGTGITLVYARARVIASADGLALILPAMLQGVNLLISTVDTLVGAVASIGASLSNLLNSNTAANGGEGGYTTVIPTINVEGVAAWIREVPAQCAPYTSSTTVIGGLMRQAASPSVCPAMRRLYVVDWLYPWVYPIVDFFALTYDPTPPYVGSENNCRATERVPRWECLVLGRSIPQIVTRARHVLTLGFCSRRFWVRHFGTSAAAAAVFNCLCGSGKTAAPSFGRNSCACHRNCVPLRAFCKQCAGRKVSWISSVSWLLRAQRLASWLLQIQSARCG